MAKRRRLSATPVPSAAGPEGGTGTEDQMGYPFGVAPTRDMQTPPVAQIAGDAATRAALDELAGQMRAAREGGRMVVGLPLSAVAVDHLTRDRQHFDADDMAALKASLRSRGQQTPIEVVALENGRYGLISGARRMAALTGLQAETGEDRFGTVLALVRSFGDAPAAYLAMVEENEIRSDLSFYERARLADEAARLGLYDSPAAAVKALFVHAPAAKRSKILNFVTLHRAIGPALRFPEAIPEKLGLALVRMLETDARAADRLRDSLRVADPRDAAAERRVLDMAAAGSLGERMQPDGQNSLSGSEIKSGSLQQDIAVAPGIRLSAQLGRAVLTGRGVDETLLAELKAWLEDRR